MMDALIPRLKAVGIPAAGRKTRALQPSFFLPFSYNHTPIR